MRYSHPSQIRDFSLCSTNCWYERSTRSVGDLDTGTWRLVGNPEKPYCYVVMKCVRCGVVTEVAHYENQDLHHKHHFIGKDGRIFPSVCCPTCRFHLWLGLRGWDPDAVEPKKEEVDG